MVAIKKLKEYYYVLFRLLYRSHIHRTWRRRPLHPGIRKKIPTPRHKQKHRAARTKAGLTAGLVLQVGDLRLQEHNLFLAQGTGLGICYL